MEGDEDALTVSRGKLFPVVPRHCVRRPMGGKYCGRSNFVCTDADLFAVATIFRRQNQLLYERVVVALGPAIISLCLQKQQLFRRKRCLLVGFIEVRPVCVQLVSPMLGHENTPARVDGKTFSVTDSRREALSRGKCLIRLIRVVEPDAT